MRYIARITDSGPLSFRAGRETNSARTLSYVPGSTLLGGLAAAHIMLDRDEDEFTAFFMQKGACFGNLYPAVFSEDSGNAELESLKDDRAPVYPIPMTARTCKRFGGFASDQTEPEDPHHGVYDSLIAWGVFALSSEECGKALEAEAYCPMCGEPMDRFTGFYRRGSKETLGHAQPERGLRTRTAIDRVTGTAKQGNLYSREILKRGNGFWGTLHVADDQASAFEDFIEQANASQLLRLGNNRTRGFGRVVLNLDRREDQISARDLRQRIDVFSAELRRRAQEVGIDVPHACYIPLTLTSDVILLDKLLRHQTVITPAYVNESWGVDDVDLIYQSSTTRRVMGWNGLWRLPKPDDTAIAQGSVFLFGLENPIEEHQVETLLAVRDQGIGARRREGFGQVVVADRFHWEVKGS